VRRKVTRQFEERMGMFNVHNHSQAYKISAFAFIAITIAVLSARSNHFDPCGLHFADTTATSEIITRISKESKLLSQNSEPLSTEDLFMKIHINEVDRDHSAPTQAHFAVLGDNIRHLTRGELFEHYGIQPFDIAEVLDDMKLIHGGFLGAGYGIYYFPSGSIFDANNFEYHRKGTNQRVNVFIKSGGVYGFGDVNTEDFDGLLLSEINGMEMIIVRYVDSENNNIYYTEFFYKNLVFLVSSANLSADDFVKVLQYLTGV
jgi:hypothetical protein